MDFGYVLKAVVQVLVVQLKRTDGLDLFLAALVYAECHNFLLMLDASVLLSLIHAVAIKWI
jgi:hypothetical protein